jgi:hypothetical protein
MIVNLLGILKISPEEISISVMFFEPRLCCKLHQERFAQKHQPQLHRAAGAP